ncbi:MAG: hypothetical protein KDD60_10975, partial [Bdellovibrionales bacterium]|nr:hypothetical protein [Bdellovibrionales bacterium]
KSDTLAFVVDLHRFSRQAFIVCSLIIINLFLLDLVVNYLAFVELKAIRRIFNIELEGSLCNWVSSIIYLSVALSLWANYAFSTRTPTQHKHKWGWLFMAFVFTYLAADDGAEIHERIGTAMNEYYEKTAWNPHFSLVRWIVDWFPSYYWQAAFTPIFLSIGCFMIWHLYASLETRTLLLFVGCGFLCFIIAQGLDYLEGIHYSFPWIRDPLSLSKRTIRHFQKSIEECLEMIGMALLLFAFLKNLALKLGSLHIRPDSEPAPPIRE